MDNPKHIDIDGVRTRYFEKGTGDPLVMIHGGEFGTGASCDVFRRNFDPLAESFHVFTFDKLGHGYTDNPKREADYTITAITEHAYRFIQAMGLEKIFLVGHSRGAFNSLCLSVEHPELIRGFVLLDSATSTPGVAAETPFYKEFRRQAGVTFHADSKEYFMKLAEALCYSKELVDERWAEERWQIAQLPKCGEAREKMKLLGRTQFDPDLERAKAETIQRLKEGRLKTPTLIFWGYNDPSAPLVPMGLELLHLLAAHNPRVSMHIVNHAGHFSHLNQWREFNREVTSFFKSLK